MHAKFYFFSFYLLVKLFTLPELIALVNKDLQKMNVIAKISCYFSAVSLH